MAKLVLLTEDQLIKSSRFVTQRADWRNVGAYPAAESSDAIRWAWEFLRRNSDYAAEYASLQEVVPGDVAVEAQELGLSIAWNVEKMVDPRLAPAFEDLHELRGKIWTSAPTSFAGVTSRIQVPFFPESAEYAYGSDETSFLNGTRRACTLHPIFLAANQVAVVITLDANIERQIRAAVEELSSTLDDEELTTSKDRRAYFQVRPAPDAPIDSYRLEDADFFQTIWDVKEIRVKLDNLQWALRCVDALAEMAERNENLAWFTREVVRVFREIGPVSKDWNKKEVFYQASVGLRYVLDNRYVTLASTDLHSQLRGLRSISK